MRILNEKDLTPFWSWGQPETEDLTNRFQTNLKGLVAVIQARMNSDRPLPPDDLLKLADELYAAGELLAKGMENCFAAAAAVSVSAANTKSERDRRQEHIDKLKAAVGHTVTLRRTSVRRLQGKRLLLEAVRGHRALLCDGEDHWETNVDHVEVLAPAGSASLFRKKSTPDG